jgi:hypothetical protein
MNYTNFKIPRASLSFACALVLTSSSWAADVITTDKINGYPGLLEGAAGFASSGDRPHATANDYAVDFTTGSGSVLIADASFLSATAANDVLAFSFWVKKYDMSASSAFWLHATSEDRAFQAHVPWSDNNIYFDTAGCCTAGETRISASTTTFPGYTDASWWDDWHHFVFFKNGADKQIWIDGQLFLQGEGSTPLPTDITSLNLGATVLGTNPMHGQMDDFAIFGNALSADDIASLFNGTAPDALGGANQLLAYWDFNDAPVFDQPVGTALGFTLSANDVGASVMDEGTLVLTLDGEVVTPTSVSKSGGITRIEYLLPNPPFVSESTHTLDVSMSDTQGNPFTTTSSFVVSPFGLLATEMVLPESAINRSQTGFKFRTYQVDATIAENGVQVAEDILAGVYGPNVAFLDDLGGVDARGYFSFTDVINLDTLIDQSLTYGNFNSNNGYPEYPIPGIPGNSLQYTYFASEILAALEFTEAGLYTMVVNSDDCFATTSGPNPLDTFTAAQLGRFDAPGGRGSADTSFQLYVQSPGLYGFRTVYQQGTGAGNIEWFMVNENGTRVLINDTTNAIPAFQWLPTPTAAYVSLLVPSDNAQAADPSIIQATIVDGPTPVDASSVSLMVDGATVAATVTKTGNEIQVSYVPVPLFASGSTHTATLAYTDAGDEITRVWTFKIAPYTKDVINDHVGMFIGTTAFAAAADRPFATAENLAVDSTGGGVFVSDASFLNLATTNDVLTFALWVKKYNMNASSAFWAISPSSPSSSRGFQAHIPWSDNNIYFDTAGCCDAGLTRISASTTTFAGYTDATWWDDWHHWVFFKNGSDKQVWIDGQLFLQGEGTAPLPTDMESLWIGNAADNNIMHGQLDDFAVYATALSATDIAALAAGTAPDALTSNPTILAYWPFDDGQASAQPTVTLDAEGNILFTGVLQESDSVTGGWTDLLEATSPYAMPTTGAMKFYRTRN